MTRPIVPAEEFAERRSRAVKAARARNLDGLLVVSRGGGTLDRYAGKLSLYDLRLVSTLGLTGDDVEAARAAYASALAMLDSLQHGNATDVCARLEALPPPPVPDQP